MINSAKCYEFISQGDPGSRERDKNKYTNTCKRWSGLERGRPGKRTGVCSKPEEGGGVTTLGCERCGWLEVRDRGGGLWQRLMRARPVGTE